MRVKRQRVGLAVCLPLAQVQGIRGFGTQRPAKRELSLFQFLYGNACLEIVVICFQYIYLGR